MARQRVAEWFGAEVGALGVARGDLLLGCLLSLFLVAIDSGPQTPPDRRISFAAALTGLGVALPVIWRRRTPQVASAAFLVGVAVNAVFAHDVARCAVAIPVAVLLLFAAGVRLGRERGLLALGCGAAAMTIETFTDPQLNAGVLLALLPMCAGAWFAGRTVGSRRALAAQLTEQGEKLERERDQTAQLAVVVERERVAARLHETTRAHVRDLIGIADSDGAELEADPQRAGAVFAEIERRSRETLNDMRSLLGALRSDERAADREPAPTLSELERLLERSRRRGCPVELDVTGSIRPLAPVVERTAYRIIEQVLEAMHSGLVELRLRFGDQTLEIDLAGKCEDGRQTDAVAAAVRERAALHDGTLTVDRTRSGHGVFSAILSVGGPDA